MERKRYDLAEQFVTQHPYLMQLSPSGLNTVRIFTQIFDNEVIVLGGRLRVSVNSTVDNMAAGNIAAPIDLQTGRVCGPGVYSDITREAEDFHPVTGLPITGFVVPFWNDILELAETAALRIPDNKSVGWDIAIREEGPELIEGNHNWCKLLWQLPVRKGLKKEIDIFL
jgi:Sugar-transfer associated ATP-grasp